MKLGVFFTPAPNPFGGTYTIKEELVRGLAVAIPGSGHELVVFTDNAAGASRFPSAGVSWITVRGLRRRALAAFVKSRVNRVFSHGLLVPPPFSSESWLDPFLLAGGIDLFINLGPEPLSMAVPYVVSVFDLQHRVQPFMPEVNARGYWERWDEQYRESLGRAAFVINGTRAGRDEIVHYYHVPLDRILRLPLPTPQFAAAAAKEPARPRPGYLKPHPFLFYPAQFWPHKNHVTLLEALALLRTEHAVDISLVLVGSDQGNKSFVLERIAAMGLSDAVHVRGFVGRDELIALYQHALALACVSTCGPESLPTLEAFALGCPVITGEAAGAREQFEGAALFASTTDPAAIARAVKTLYDDPAERASMIAASRAVAAERTPERFGRGLLEAIAPFEGKRRNWSARQPYVRPHHIWRILGG